MSAHAHPENVSTTACVACREEAEARMIRVLVCPECGPSPFGASPSHAYDCSEPDYERWFFAPVRRAEAEFRTVSRETGEVERTGFASAEEAARDILDNAPNPNAWAVEQRLIEVTSWKRVDA